VKANPQSSRAIVDMVTGVSTERTLPAGTRTRVFSRRFSGIPQAFGFDAVGVDGAAPAGTVERVGSRWVFGRTREVLPLRERNTLRKGYWDAFFDVYVTPEAPVRITMTRTPTHRRLIWTLAAVVVIAAAAILVITSLD